MGLRFFDSAIGGKRDRVMAVDLGSRTTKAVCLARRGSSFALSGYALLDAPICDKTLSPDLLAEHLKAVSEALHSTTRHVALTVGVNDSLVRHADISPMPLRDMRMVLKLNPKNYLQQDLSGYVFDCHICVRPQQHKPADTPKRQDAVGKQKVLVAGARQQLVNDYIQGARGAGLTAQCIVPGLIGSVNTFEEAMPELFAKEAVALVDLGFKSSSICILREGELILARVVSFGGDKITSGLAETLNISYAEAEGIKMGMPTEVKAQLESLLLPLGRELRASIDFFEHQQDCPVAHVFVTGGASGSEYIVQNLKQELMADCQILDPSPLLQLELPPQQAADFEPVAPQLTTALGTALAAL